MIVDAVVVGAGHNGLVAANLLADAGWSVVVLEATDAPGGAVRSEPMNVPGFSRDRCSAFYPFAAASRPLAALDLHEYGLRWRHAPHVLAHLLPDDRAAVLSRDVAATAASVDAFAPGDGEAWQALSDEWDAIADGLLDMLFTPFPPVRPGLALLRRLRTAGAVRLARRLALPVDVFCAERFRGEGAAALLAGCALHTDLAPQEPGSAVFGWLLTMVGQRQGFPVAVGGAQAITDALVARLAKGGGAVVTDAPVAQVDVAGGRATGVTLADGRRFGARRAVVADTPAPTLYRHLVGERHLPAQFVADLAEFHWDTGTLKIDWALSGPVPWRNPAVSGAGTVHFDLDLNGMIDYSSRLRQDRVPDRPLLVAGQMTTSDPSRSPAGTESLWAYTHLPHARDWTPEQIDAQVERVEQVFADHAPGFRSLVLDRVVTGPAELAQENPSLVGGAINGGTAAIYQQLFFRPVPNLSRADTPIDRLYLGSASAHPGGGVHGGPGANAARAALARDRALAGSVYRVAIGAAQRALYRKSVIGS